MARIVSKVLPAVVSVICEVAPGVMVYQAVRPVTMSVPPQLKLAGSPVWRVAPVVDAVCWPLPTVVPGKLSLAGAGAQPSVKKTASMVRSAATANVYGLGKD